MVDLTLQINAEVHIFTALLTLKTFKEDLFTLNAVSMFKRTITWWFSPWKTHIDAPNSLYLEGGPVGTWMRFPQKISSHLYVIDNLRSSFDPNFIWQQGLSPGHKAGMEKYWSWLTFRPWWLVSVGQIKLLLLYTVENGGSAGSQSRLLNTIFWSWDFWPTDAVIAWHNLVNRVLLLNLKNHIFPPMGGSLADQLDPFSIFVVLFNYISSWDKAVWCIPTLANHKNFPENFDVFIIEKKVLILQWHPLH